MKKSVCCGLILLFLASVVLAKESVGKCNIGFGFRITDQYGKPLEDVSVSYVLNGSIHTPNRKYSGNSSKNWYNRGTRQVNFSIPASLIEFSESHVVYEFRFIKDGYFDKYHKERIHKSSGYHDPIINIEMVQRKRANINSNNTNSSQNNHSLNSSTNSSDQVSYAGTSYDSITRLANEVRALAVQANQSGMSVFVENAMEINNRLYVGNGNKDGTLFVILIEQNGAPKFVDQLFASRTDAENAIYKIKQGRKLYQQYLAKLNQNSGDVIDVSKIGPSTDQQKDAIRQKIKKETPQIIRFHNRNLTDKKLYDRTTTSGSDWSKTKGGWKNVEKSYCSEGRYKSELINLKFKIVTILDHEMTVIKPMGAFNPAKYSKEGTKKYKVYINDELAFEKTVSPDAKEEDVVRFSWKNLDIGYHKGNFGNGINWMYKILIKDYNELVDKLADKKLEGKLGSAQPKIPNKELPKAAVSKIAPKRNKQKDVVKAKNIALKDIGATATANGSYGKQNASFAIDNDSTTYWAGRQRFSPQQLTIEFDQSYAIGKIVIDEERAYIRKATVECFNGVYWGHLLSIEKGTPDYEVGFLPVIAKKVRLNITSVSAPGGWSNKVACIHAFEVYGVPK